MKKSATAAPINTKRLANLVSSLYARDVDFLEGRYTVMYKDSANPTLTPLPVTPITNIPLWGNSH